MTINKTNTRKNAVEICKELTKNGTTIEYIVINGQKVGMLGCTSEKDRQKAMDALQTALDACDGNIYEMMQKLSTVAMMQEKEIKPDEMVKICGHDVILSYEQGKAYTVSGKEIANCDDLPKMPTEAIKAVLEARAKAALR